MIAEATLRSEVEAWSVRLRVRPKQVRLQPMKLKWASCSSAGRITLSRDLLKQPRSFRDYVIAHELLHLRIRNHGKLFDRTLRAHLAGNPWPDKAAAGGRPRGAS
ncbi:MAG: M48 family metallopeptidase [Xanthomonadales bacterium]|nr:M48 family metallopeptidase [Xanthomonadales bacterium]